MKNDYFPANISVSFFLAIFSTAAASTVADAAINCVAPPVLSNPIVYDGKCPGDSGFPTTVKAGGRDVYIKLPTNKTCSKRLGIDYARNIRITGGNSSSMILMMP